MTWTRVALWTRVNSRPRCRRSTRCKTCQRLCACVVGTSREIILADHKTHTCSRFSTLSGRQAGAGPGRVLRGSARAGGRRRRGPLDAHVVRVQGALRPRPTAPRLRVGRQRRLWVHLDARDGASAAPPRRPGGAYAGVKRLARNVTTPDVRTLPLDDVRPALRVCGEINPNVTTNPREKRQPSATRDG